MFGFVVQRAELDAPVTIDIAPESVPGLVGDLFEYVPRD
jgi:hypothetical protein